MTRGAATGAIVAGVIIRAGKRHDRVEQARFLETEKNGIGPKLGAETAFAEFVVRFPGKPDDKLSERGFGTELRTDPVFLGLQKTRLLDPVMSLPGTNDHPGDYRASGCTACHVIYANDRDPSHSAAYAPFGHSGFSASSDPTIPKNESGHPIKHTFTRPIPS